MPRPRAVLLLVLTGSLALASPSAAAGPSAEVALVPEGAKVRLVVTVTSPSAPRSVGLVVSGRAVGLRRSARRGRTTTWRSGAAGGSAGQRLRSAARRRVTVRIRLRGWTVVRRVVVRAPTNPGVPAQGGTTPGTTPAPGGTTPPAGPSPTAPPPAAPPGITLKRDDGAAQAQWTPSQGQDLLLERASFGSSGQTAEYLRISVFADGRLKVSQIDWNSVSGEICRRSITGTWVFKEGYTFAERGGGAVLILTATANGQTGDEAFVVSNTSQNVGFKAGQSWVELERNPNMNDNCS